MVKVPFYIANDQSTSSVACQVDHRQACVNASYEVDCSGGNRRGNPFLQWTVSIASSIVIFRKRDRCGLVCELASLSERCKKKAKPVSRPFNTKLTARSDTLIRLSFTRTSRAAKRKLA